MRQVLLDTNIVSDILTRSNPTVLAHAAAYAEHHDRFTFTAVTVHEILYGLHHKDAKKQLANAESSFLENEVILPVLEDYRRSGEIRGLARTKESQLTFDDCLIGAVAERIGLPVATDNTGHFESMQQVGLAMELENWREP